MIVCLIFDQVFSPKVVAYVTKRVNEALERLTATKDESRQRRDQELVQAKRELENVQRAILQGITTPTTKSMLEQCEHRVAELEAALPATEPRIRRAVALPQIIEGYLLDLRDTLSKDTAKARALIGKMVGTITLRPEGERLVGEIGGNLPALLDVELAKSGAGRGI